MTIVVSPIDYRLKIYVGKQVTFDVDFLVDSTYVTGHPG